MTLKNPLVDLQVQVATLQLTVTDLVNELYEKNIINLEKSMEQFYKDRPFLLENNPTYTYVPKHKRVKTIATQTA